MSSLDDEFRDLIELEGMQAETRAELETVMAELQTGHDLGNDWSSIYPTYGISVSARRGVVNAIRRGAGLPAVTWVNPSPGMYKS